MAAVIPKETRKLKNYRIFGFEIKNGK